MPDEQLHAPNEKEKHLIIALEDVNYDWRTIEGLGNAIKSEKDEIEKMLQKLQKDGKVLCAISPKSGEYVYTTIKRYKETHSYADISLSSLTGRTQY